MCFYLTSWIKADKLNLERKTLLTKEIKMKKFDSLTNQQKEYFYAWGTVASVAVLGLIAPPLAIITSSVAGIMALLVISVHMLDCKTAKAKN